MMMNQISLRILRSLDDRRRSVRAHEVLEKPAAATAKVAPTSPGFTILGRTGAITDMGFPKPWRTEVLTKVASRSTHS